MYPFCHSVTTNIQEELQISQDFLLKHRTNHPDYEPTYEQLYNILKKVETQPDPQPIVPLSKARYSRSALPQRKEARGQAANVQSYHPIVAN